MLWTVSVIWYYAFYQIRCRITSVARQRGEGIFNALAVSTSADVPVSKERHRAGVEITYVPATYFLGVPPGNVTTADVFAGIVKTHFHSSPS